MTDETGWRDNPIAWIKEYRRRSGCFLKEAKDAFDTGKAMPGESSWRPIETALRANEEHVLVWIQYTPEEAARAEQPGRREVARWTEHCGGWLLDHDSCNERHNITLWQPLPPPPAPKEPA